MNPYILITGATSGIGEQCALSISKDKNIVLSGRNHEKLDALRTRCNNSERHIIWQCDFETERENIYNSLNSLLKDNEITIDSYINCAGVTQILPIKNFSTRYIDKIFNVNFFSTIEILRALLKKDNKNALKCVILISGLWSIRGDVGNSIYASSKGAINSLVYSLAQELAPDVRINAVSPGAILTPMTKTLLSDEASMSKILKDYPLGLGSMEDVVNYIEFLLSDKSKWVTGQNIIIDGGRSTK